MHEFTHTINEFLLINMHWSNTHSHAVLYEWHLTDSTILPPESHSFAITTIIFIEWNLSTMDALKLICFACNAEVFLFKG